MSKAKMTLIGLENYCQGAGESLFEGLVLPSGINKDDVVNTILMRSGEFEILYSDPVFLKASISLWGRNWYATFARWLETLTEEYNPLHNYDRTEEWTDDHTGDYSKKNNASVEGDSTRTDDLTQTTDMTRENDLTEEHDLATSNDVTTTNDVSAYNSSTYDHDNKQIVDQDGTDTGTITNTGTISDDGTIKNEGTVKNEYKDKSSGTESGDDNSKNTHKGRMFGNIGVTTSATMATEELTLRGKYVLNTMIADTFVKEFCLMVY